MPQLGESVREGTIAKWLVKAGDRIAELDPLVEVDTDKVNAQIPAPNGGIVRELLVREGESVLVGADIAVIDEAGGSESAGATAGSGVSHAGPADASAMGAVEAVRSLSPAVASLARLHGLDLSTIAGTGEGGRVTKRDVNRALESRPDPTPSQPPARELAAGDELLPLTRARRLVAEHTTRSKATIPHAWQTQEVDMGGVVASRETHKRAFHEQEGFGLSFVPYVLAATVAGLRAEPKVNATWTEDGILLHRQIHLGVAVGLEDSVVIPVIRDADALSIAGLARKLNDLSTRARERALKPDEIFGGTFTVNNSGTFGTLLSYSVINPGQAGILTMEAIVDRPIAKSGMLAIRPMMYLCFSLDHRILDGLAAARFLSTCRTWLEAVTIATPIY
jgi:2-oxoisovalerate dehydrogenase E2 component (dihydrolipoyl transacylase)